MMSPLYQYDLAKGIYENYPEIPNKEYVVAALDKVEDSSGIDVFYEILTEIYGIQNWSHHNIVTTMIGIVTSANAMRIYTADGIIQYAENALEQNPMVKELTIPVLKSMFYGDGAMSHIRTIGIEAFDYMYHTALEERAKKEIHGE